ncbi:aldo/keto reductase [Apilactobacillus xinyiensis]|uniref:aldo/keto reductase n=1 Tax=Apilactobacillus xinyiensis TaxID=2841032 RepID=UPI001C7D9546|nr:aldo/keto reductase [Apilactobacillus xinyiensis]MCL0312071.1 aldo/keto reductase [Apilactobacillus xinyiensis]MCL0330407.1 aldo/keto reductase [Apilactobacillus xinyiensis]
MDRLEGLEQTTTLNNGVKMPKLGLGVWKTDNKSAKESVKTAIKKGYHLIDTAKQYGNETGVGEGIKEALAETGMNRKDLFITTKLFNGDQGYESTINALEGTLKRLDLTYLDLYLVHWPVDGKYVDTWKAMEHLYRQGKIRAIGVSNFDNERLQDLLDHADIVPAVNQMETNPINQEKGILEFNNHAGIQLEAWSPLGGGEALSNPEVNKIAEKHNKSAAQVILRWDWQRGFVTIPKSSHEERIIQNSDIFDFKLSDAEMEAINQLDKGKRSLWYENFAWHGGEYVDEVDHWDDSPENYKD